MLSQYNQKLWSEALNILTELLQEYYALDADTAYAAAKCYIVDGKVDLVDFSKNHGNQMLYRAYVFDIGYLYGFRA